MENGVAESDTTNDLPETAKSEFLLLAFFLNHDLSEI